MVTEVAACASDPGMLEWALRIMIVSRQLERVGDHAVDIGEQVAFLLTGEFREFTDASHPEIEGDLTK
jgi:phosphate transport system protein